MFPVSTPDIPPETLEVSENFFIPMYILSNAETDNGAAALCYKGVLDDFARKIGDDLVILPSSVHETILLPMHKNDDIGRLRDMVYDINRTVLDRSEFLSDNVYIFNRESKQLAIA